MSNLRVKAEEPWSKGRAVGEMPGGGGSREKRVSNEEVEAEEVAGGKVE